MEVVEGPCLVSLARDEEISMQCRSSWSTTCNGKRIGIVVLG